MLKKNYDAIVVGAGIVGLAMARALAKRDKSVLVLERSEFAVGASIRNFGMVWPIGQPEGDLYERALLSRRIWQEICQDSSIWYEEAGSLHLAYSELEMEVINAFYGQVKSTRPYSLLDATEACKMSSSIVSHNLVGGLHSPEEMIVDSPKAIKQLPAYLHECLGVEFLWKKPVHTVETGLVYSGADRFEADEIFVCSGPDFESLFPDLFAKAPITRCKLQMMRFAAQPDAWRMGPSLCGGLSLLHYKGFQAAGNILDQLHASFEQANPDFFKWGIHVMVSQNEIGELIIGDSHEYGHTHDPFERSEINELILNYLSSFARFDKEKIAATWNGIYPKMTDGRTEFIQSPHPGITVVNGLGGAGMTLSFGLCEQLVGGQYKHTENFINL
jgi:FAD dependent oxidoreductase TIGR03364